MKPDLLTYVSNKADFLETYEVIDEETNTPLSLASTTLAVAIEDWDSGQIMLTGSSATGECTLVDSNTKFQVAFSASRMNNLSAKTYRMGALITGLYSAGDKQQMLIGYLPVLDGIV